MAAAGDEIEQHAPSLGSRRRGTGRQLSQSEIDALRTRLSELLEPAGRRRRSAAKLIVEVGSCSSRTGRSRRRRWCSTSGSSPLFWPRRDSAMRAVLRGQPFTMLRPEHYEQWKDIEITFDPRDMMRRIELQFASGDLARSTIR